MSESMHDEGLEARLRADARAWSDAPSPAAAARLSAAIAELPARRRAGPRLAAALAGLAALPLLYAWSARAPEPAAPPVSASASASASAPAPAPRPKVAVDAAIAPLEHELVALTGDASALAGAVWQGVPRPLRELFGE